MKFSVSSCYKKEKYIIILIDISMLWFFLGISKSFRDFSRNGKTIFEIKYENIKRRKTQDNS